MRSYQQAWLSRDLIAGVVLVTLLAGLFSGFPVTAGSSRTAVADQSGPKPG